MAGAGTKIGHGLAKVLGIKLQSSDPFVDAVTHGATTARYVEQPPSTKEFVSGSLPSKGETVAYFRSLFPFLGWIGHYNAQWLAGDLVAGITIGAVVVPQGMAYAVLANLEPQFGLYSSFMGVLIYWFFATSKDITIGPVAVLSTLTGGVVADMAVQFPDVPAHVVASALAVVSGAIVLLLGLTRTGFIVDLISLTSLSAFMTGSSITISVGQIPTMMGITGFSTREAPYMVFINTLKNLGNTQLDAAMGLSALAMLYSIRTACSMLAKRLLHRQKLIFFISTLRTAFVIIIYTLISFLVNKDHKTQPSFQILQDIPRGFQNAAVPVLEARIVGGFASYLPATVIVLLVEHIAIAKAFGRVGGGYTVNPSQEMVAIGLTNVLGPFLGGYPSTGSFSRTAIKSKAGVRTPFAGIITALVVLLAIYALPPVFYYIPNASLAAVIIHAVGDLITPPNTVYEFWRVDPVDVLIFFIGVFVTVFSTIENGIYATVAASAAVFLGRILKARGRFLGRVKIHSVLGDRVIGDDHRQVSGHYGTFKSTTGPAARNVFLPIDHDDGSNPDVDVGNPYPGVFIYRFSQGFNYPNASHSMEYLTEYIFAHTRRTNLAQYKRPGDRPWNDPGPSRRQMKRRSGGDADAFRPGENPALPTLKAVVLDFSSVNHVDITSVQQLIDTRSHLDRYAAPDLVDWHIACITNRWTKRALSAAGFGYPAEQAGGRHHRWRSIFSVAEIGGSDSAAAVAEKEINEKELAGRDGPGRRGSLDAKHSEYGGETDVDVDVELAAAGARHRAGSDQRQDAGGHAEAQTGWGSGSEEGQGPKPDQSKGEGPRRAALAVTVHGMNRPLFHVDLTSALQSAVANIEARADSSAEDSGLVSAPG